MCIDIRFGWLTTSLIFIVFFNAGYKVDSFRIHFLHFYQAYFNYKLSVFPIKSPCHLSLLFAHCVDRLYWNGSDGAEIAITLSYFSFCCWSFDWLYIKTRSAVECLTERSLRALRETDYRWFELLSPPAVYKITQCGLKVVLFYYKWPKPLDVRGVTSQNPVCLFF